MASLYDALLAVARDYSEMLGVDPEVAVGVVLRHPAMIEYANELLSENEDSGAKGASLAPADYSHLRQIAMQLAIQADVGNPIDMAKDIFAYLKDGT